MPVRRKHITELESRSYVRRTPAGMERVVDLYLSSDADRFASLKLPVELSAEETAYLSSQLRELAAGFVEAAQMKCRD